MELLSYVNVPLRIVKELSGQRDWGDLVNTCGREQLRQIHQQPFGCLEIDHVRAGGDERRGHQRRVNPMRSGSSRRGRAALAAKW